MAGPWEKYGAQTKPANPMLPGQFQSQQLNNQRTAQEISQAQATASATTAKAKAEALSASIKAKQDQEAYDSAHPKGNTSTVLGPDSLKSLSAPDQEIVKALADGRLAFPAGFALKAPWWQQKLEQVAAYDPSFDATNFNNRAKARAMLLTGKVGASANALNTSMGHLGLLQSQISGTASHNFTPVNALINKFEQLTGDPGITNFKDTAGKLASELTSVYRNGGGAEADVVRQLESVDPNASEAQKQGIVRNALELLASKQAANLYQYNIGSGGKPPVDLLDPSARKVLDQFPDIRDKYFGATAPSLSRQASAVLTAHGGTPPSAPPPAPPGSTPPTLGSGPVTRVPTADYSGMTGADQNVATGSTRSVYDPVTSGKLNALVHAGRSADEANAVLPPNTTPIDPKQWNDAVAYAKDHPNWMAAQSTTKIPTTLMQRLSASAPAAGIAASGAGATAGLSDVLARKLAGPAWDANRAALSAEHPAADITGNVAGGTLGMLGLSAAAPGALAKISGTLGKLAAPTADAAYGGVYGASENPDNPLAGGLKGTLAGIGGGIAGRAVTRGVGNIIAPPAGDFAPLYEAGVYPTPGQRFSQSGIPGRALNVVEQAMQSVPVLGAAPAAARQATRDAFQVGAFNKSLNEIGTSLPKGVGPGTLAHSYASEQFDKAYNAARSGMQFVPDPQYLSEAQALSQKVNSGVLDPQQAKQVSDVVNNTVVGRLKSQGGALNGDAYKSASSDLGKAIETWGKNPNTAPMADALSEYQTIFDNAARRNSNPQAVNLLDAADRGYAQFVRIQKASQLGGAAKEAGTFTPGNYAGAVKQMGGGLRTNAYSQGNALGQDYAQSGLNLSDKLADSGTPTRLGVLGALQGAEGAGLAATGSLGALVHPATLAAFAPYLPVLRGLVNRSIAPNAQRLSALPPDVAAALDRIGSKINNLAPIAGKAGTLGSLAYFGGP